MNKSLLKPKLVVFTAYSKRNFYQSFLISRFCFDQGAVPINPFTNFGYFLYELVDRDVVRNGNNNLIFRADELWVFGDISDGVAAEIDMVKKAGKPIRYYDINGLPEEVKEISEKDSKIEEDN